MKRIGNIYSDIVTIKNLYIASKNAQKGKSNYKEIIEWNKNLEENIQRLYNELINKSYVVSEYFIFTIYDPKERVISKSPYRDRVVQHLILLYLKPIFVKYFISQTYSCIPTRGIHKCLNDLSKGLKDKQNSYYCLKLDIKKFYPSISTDILKIQLRRKFKDPDLLELLDKIIGNNIGLPLGSYSSQYLANFYLTPFDRWLKQDKKILRIYRYCDDIVILHSDKNFLYNLKSEIIEYLRVKLNLELSNYQVFPVYSRGINFVGYISYHDYIKLRKSIKRRFKLMIKYNLNFKSINSYFGWTLHSNCRNLEYQLLKHIIYTN